MKIYSDWRLVKTMAETILFSCGLALQQDFMLGLGV